jgi:hypothetical protein
MSRTSAALAAVLALGACGAEAPAFNAEAPAVSPPTFSAEPDPDGPPVEDGVYIYLDCEGEGGCPYRNWRTREETDLLAEATTGSAVLATLTPGEWVSVETVETRLVPLRGVVLQGAENIDAGETVYQLEYEGEGYSNYWIKGAYGFLPEEARVEWEQQPEPSPELAAQLGLWARVKRESGEVGWVQEPKFECMGQLAGDEGCRD